MRLNSAVGSLVISLVTTLVLVGAAWGALSERSRIDTKSIAELKGELAVTKAELASMKSEHANALTAFARSDEQIKAMAEDVRELKQDVKVLLRRR